MALTEEIKKLRKEHKKLNDWLESRGRAKLPIPENLKTEKERQRDAAKAEKEKRKLEEKRAFDLQVKEIYGLKLPYEWMSHFIRGAGHDKRVRVIEKRELMNYSRIDGNTCNGRGQRTKQKFMMFDIDDTLSVDEFFRITGVMPNYFVGKQLPDGRMHRPHAIIEIMYPVPLEAKNSRGEIHWFERLYDRIYERLRAADVDVDYGQKTTFKNPDYDGWDVEVSKCGPVLLRHLQDDLDRRAYLDEAFQKTLLEITGLPKQARQLAKFDIAPRQRFIDTGKYSGRNETLFHTVRLRIIADWNLLKGQDIYTFSHSLLKDLNASKGYRLPACELRSIAKSHSKFFAKYKGPKNPNRKVRNEGAAKHLILWHMTKREKQAIGAYYTHAVCTSKTAKLVQDYKKANPGATISQTAKDLGIDRKTVRRYFYLASPTDLPALRKIKELRESAAAYWQAKNLTCVVIGNIWGGESGPIRENGDTKATQAAEPDQKIEAAKELKSLRFPSSLVVKIRHARLRHTRIEPFRLRTPSKPSDIQGCYTAEKPEIDFLAEFH